MSLLCKLGRHDWVTKEINGAFFFFCTRCSKTKLVQKKKEKTRAI
ncbi:DUF1660 family phage protein [Chloroflexota bacterium]